MPWLPPPLPSCPPDATRTPGAPRAPALQLHLLRLALDPFGADFMVPSFSELAPEKEAGQQCRTFVAFTQLLAGYVVPSLVLARFQGYLRAGAAANGGGDLGQRWGGASDDEGAPEGRRCSRWRVLWQETAGRVTAPATHLACLLGGAAGGWWSCAACWCLFLSCCWLLAAQLEQQPT